MHKERDIVSTYISTNIGARDEGTEIEGSGNAGEANSSNDARQRGAD